jgi:arylsulfatase A-like enzyme
MNIILVILDSLRQDHVGAYGNEWIVTPHLDAFAKEAVLFTRCYPDSLPTLPVRRALHTGLRTYPFRDHRDYKGDFSGAPGWGPIPEEQTTVSEMLSKRGYRTAFITDCYHQFKPSRNFHRGFDQWTWIRGQETDKYLSGPVVPDEVIARHIPSGLKEHKRLWDFLRRYLTNNAYRVSEADYYPARVFGEAARWVSDNQDAEKCFLVVDSFDPHEPWDPPRYYRALYDPEEMDVDPIQSPYDRWRKHFTPREVKRLQANYAGEVTMVDRWFGHFMEALRVSGRLQDSVVAVISDHGHNLGHDPGDKGLVSKQGYPMTHAVADLVLMIRHPKGEGAATRCDALCYNHDLTATLLALASEKPETKLDGVNVWPVARGKAKAIREYVTVAWGALVTVIDDQWWYNDNLWNEGPTLYRVKEDPELRKDLAARHPKVCKRMLQWALDDAGGTIPDILVRYKPRFGCTPYAD